MTIKRTILITGGTSGIGFEATKMFLNNGHNVISLCRNNDRENELNYKLEKEILNPDNLKGLLRTYSVDLSNLRLINECINKILLEIKFIDSLVLNAGLQYTGFKEPIWTSDGIELTFAVNHLSHHFLATKLFSLLENSKNPRIVITSSEVHNPKSPGGRVGSPASLGDLKGIKSGLGFSMIDGNPIFNADKAYKDSKLCNLLFASELYRRLNFKKEYIPVIAWAPGLVIPRSRDGFFKYSRKKNEIGTSLFAFIARDLLNITESPKIAGKILFNLSTEERYKEICFSYRSNRLIRPGKKIFEYSPISDEAADNKISEDLWNFSDKLIKECLDEN
tara:strand:+ start:1794 stop:2798 length:1005 start_codon:yes stop_codon:yes gene_type:complete